MGTSLALPDEVFLNSMEGGMHPDFTKTDRCCHYPRSGHGIFSQAAPGRFLELLLALWRMTEKNMGTHVWRGKLFEPSLPFAVIAPTAKGLFMRGPKLLACLGPRLMNGQVRTSC